MDPIPSGRRLAAAVAAIAILAAGCGTVTPSSPAAPSGPRASAPTVPSAASTGAAPSGSGPTGTASAVPSAGLGASFDPSGQTVASEVVVAGLAAPVDVATAGDGSGRMFVVEQAGRIRVVKDRTIAAEPFLDITNEVASGGERGLLGLAFHPDYATNGLFYVHLTNAKIVCAAAEVARERGRPVGLVTDRELGRGQGREQLATSHGVTLWRVVASAGGGSTCAASGEA